MLDHDPIMQTTGAAKSSKINMQPFEMLKVHGPKIIFFLVFIFKIKEEKGGERIITLH